MGLQGAIENKRKDKECENGFSHKDPRGGLKQIGGFWEVCFFSGCVGKHVSKGFKKVRTGLIKDLQQLVEASKVFYEAFKRPLQAL